MLKTVGNIAEEAIKACVIDMKITWVSNYRYPMTKSSNWTPLRACLHGGGGPQVGEVTRLGGVTLLSI